MREAQTSAAEEARPKEVAWYVVHTQAGAELKVKSNLEKRKASLGMEGQIFRVLVPMEEYIEVREGKKRTVKRKVFPGYVLVEMVMSEDSYNAVRYTPGVTGFVGGARPSPLEPAEVEALLRRIGLEEARPKVDLAPGDNVRVSSGPFEGFIGVVDEVSVERGKVRVLVSMFGRETPVEIDFVQVEKL